MLPEYRTIYRGGEDEIVEKKSRFIATVVPVNTEEEALEFVEKTRKKYWDARHNCFAYIKGGSCSVLRRKNRKLFKYISDMKKMASK